jgi:hypothetical protein
MLCSLAAYFIVTEVQSGECLYEVVSDIRREWECYFVLIQSASKMFCSFDINFIAIEFQCSEGLCKVVIESYQRMGMLLCFVPKHQQDVVLL